jgi:mRNA-degrading endonuclease RelE of RelBE toxin-antitoxin system
MKIVAAASFGKTVKKMHDNAKRDLDAAVDKIAGDPLAGEMKKGDIGGIRVYKFRMVNQQTLLAYVYDEAERIITLLAVDPHENFYRGLKR